MANVQPLPANVSSYSNECNNLSFPCSFCHILFALPIIFFPNQMEYSCTLMWLSWSNLEFYHSILSSTSAHLDELHQRIMDCFEKTPNCEMNVIRPINLYGFSDKSRTFCWISLILNFGCSF